MFALRCVDAKEKNLNVHGSSMPAPESSADDDLALLKRPQLARAVSVSPRTIDNWVAARKIPFIKLSARCIRFHLPSVLAALRRFEVREVK